jgi:hypothetical protein
LPRISAFNLSEQAAQTAARGRDGGSSLRSVSESDDWASRARKALSEMSDAECDQMWAEEQRKRKKAPAKKTTATSGKLPQVASRPAVVSEINGRVVK